MYASLAAPLQSVQEIATDSRFGELVKFFFIALAIVGPSSGFIFWRMNRKKGGLRGDRPQPTVEEPDESTAPDPDEVATIVAAIDAAARSLGAGESTTIDVPAALRLNGVPAPAAIAQALISDAIGRTRLHAVWSDAADGSRRLTLTR